MASDALVLVPPYHNQSTKLVARKVENSPQLLIREVPYFNSCTGALHLPESAVEMNQKKIHIVNEGDLFLLLLPFRGSAPIWDENIIKILFSRQTRRMKDGHSSRES
jgi:hypothetical protein